MVLASMAGTALVQAMETDNWESVRPKVARLFRRGQRNPAIERRLDETRHQLDSASPAVAEQVKADVAGQWRTRFADLLAEHSDAWAELRALVDELKPVNASAGATPQAVPDSTWQTEMQTFIVGRYDRVQTAAQTWLTIMTTLFGVFSTVVVVSGGKTISEIQDLRLRIVVVVVAALVFGLAFAATMYGLFASWGGLGAVLTRATEKPEKPERQLEEQHVPVLTRIGRGLKDSGQELKDMWRPDPLKPEDVTNAQWL